VGVALSGGGAKGVAHIGVLMVLEEMGVPIDYVSGTSMGSIIGGLYAAGYTPEQMLELVKEVDWNNAFLPAPDRRLLRLDQKQQYEKYQLELGITDQGLDMPRGVVTDYKLTTMLTRLCLHVADINDFDQLPIPFRAVATDIESGDKVVLRHGNLALAMRASMSIPSIFPPFELDGRLLVDGGVVENLPVRTVRDMGADIVIAVDIGAPLKKREQLKDLLDIMDQTVSLQIVRSTQFQRRLADMVVSPEVQEFGLFDFKKADDLVRLGREAMTGTREELTALLEAKGVALAVRPHPACDIVEKVVVEKVTLVGPERYQYQLKQLAPFKPGQEVSSITLDQTAQKLYGLGVFETVTYEVIPQPDGRSEVRFIVQEKQGKVLGRLGVNLGLNSNGLNLNRFNLNFRIPNLPNSGSFVEVDLTGGALYEARVSMLLDSFVLPGFYLRPEIHVSSQLHDLLKDQEVMAEYYRNDFGGSLTTGYYLGTWGEIYLGLLAMDSTIDPRVSSFSMSRETDTLVGWQAGLGLDTLDKSPFPQRGFQTRLNYTQMMPDLGSDVDYSRLIWDWRWAIPLGARQTLEPNFTWATSFESEPPISQTLYLGGYNGMWGYAHEEFSTQDLTRFQLLYRYRFKENIYLLLGGNAGLTNDTLSERQGFGVSEGDILFGGGVGAAWNSMIGPFSLVLSHGEGGRFNFYFNYGYHW
jgi:NTE family protein